MRPANYSLSRSSRLVRAHTAPQAARAAKKTHEFVLACKIYAPGQSLHASSSSSSSAIVDTTRWYRRRCDGGCEEQMAEAPAGSSGCVECASSATTRAGVRDLARCVRLTGPRAAPMLFLGRPVRKTQFGRPMPRHSPSSFLLLLLLRESRRCGVTRSLSVCTHGPSSATLSLPPPFSPSAYLLILSSAFFFLFFSFF